MNKPLTPALRRQLVVGNWKLHGSIAKNQALIAQLIDSLQYLHHADFAVCVPYPYFFQAQDLLTGTNIAWGSQNVSQFDHGAYTSSISASMIAEFGCKFAIIGHSERRSLSHESNEKAAIRFTRALSAGITPIYCVGETLAEHESGHAQQIVHDQVLAITQGLDDAMFAAAKQLGAVIAYEPVWAIGTGQAATAEQAQTMHAYIRQLIAARDEDFSQKVRIIYGGSVTPKNAYHILTMPDIDGSLVGRSALIAADFAGICAIANSIDA